MKQLILASQSPRRKMLLEQLGLTGFLIRPARGPEPLPAENLSPAEAVRAIALAKGREVAATARPGELVLAADTMVCLDGALLGKPRDEAEAVDMLTQLSGAKHTVYTGVALFLDGKIHTGVEATDVFFRPLSPEEIQAYVATGEPMDKAGSYGLQGLASVFVRRIEGDMYNVIGLPLCRVAELAAEMGVRLF
jgi:septum formation protein